MIDGGYYAIKGFDYQIDKTILEIVSCPDVDSPVAIEQIQDINTDNFVMQVKYRETQAFLPSKIKAPVIQLLEEFIECAGKKDRIYYLYCYFLDKAEGEQTLTLEYLNAILGNKSSQFLEEVKQQFVANFVLIFSPDFQAQFSDVIDRIKAVFKCSTHEEAIVHYSTVVRELRAIVVSNPDPAKRVFTLRQLTQLVENNKKIVFESGLTQLMDEASRFKLVRSNFVKLRKNCTNYIFLGDVQQDGTISLEKLVTDFLAEYYRNATRDIVPPVLIVSNMSIGNIKKRLIKEEIIFNDGYEAIQFNYKIFTSPPILNPKVTSGGRKTTDSLGAISFKVRLIAFATYETISAHEPLPDMVYAFNAPNIRVPEGVSSLSIDCLSTKRIYELLI